MLESIEKDLNDKLRTQPISPKVLLDRLRLLDESSRKTSQYQDPSHFPFYYYLSKSTSPKSIFNVGLDLALPLCCFLMGNPGVERVLAFQKDDKTFYSPRIAVSNIKDIRPSGLSLDYYRGGILDEGLESKMDLGFDMVIVSSKMDSDEMNDVLDISWKHMNLDGIMSVDQVRSNPKVGEIFKSFCKVQNRTPAFVDTRYGTGIVIK